MSALGNFYESGVLSVSNSSPLPHSSQNKFSIVFSWALVVVMAGVIFFMSANTGDSINHGLGIISAIKAALSSFALSLFGHSVDVSPVGHFTEYLIFGILLANALRFHMPLKRALIIAVVIGSAYGVTDEIHQLFVPDRSCDPADWAVDTVASFVGACITYAAVRHRDHRSH